MKKEDLTLCMLALVFVAKIPVEIIMTKTPTNTQAVKLCASPQNSLQFKKPHNYLFRKCCSGNWKLCNLCEIKHMLTAMSGVYIFSLCS